MFSNLIKITFASTAYAPVILTWWLVSIYNIYHTGGSVVFIKLNNFNNLINKANLIFVFLFLLFIAWYILLLAKNKLTRNTIKVKSIKSSDYNMNTLIFSYSLPCIELYNKSLVYFIAWILAVCIVIYINKGTYFYNPVMKLFKYNYYEIVTQQDVTYQIISKQPLRNKNEITTYSHLTDFVLLNSSNNK